jgi:hypothetical protein
MLMRVLRTVCIAGGAGLMMAAPALSVPIDRYVTVQPVQVCDDNGQNCAALPASLQLGATTGVPTDTFANKIWSNASAGTGGIGLTFLPVITLNETDYLQTNVSNNSLTDEVRQLTRTPRPGIDPTSATINLFIVNQLVPTDFSGIVYGFGYINGNGVAVTSNARLDTIAHEIGHNFGLDHGGVFGAGTDRRNLMQNGGGSFPRIVPQSILDVTTSPAPNTVNTDRLTSTQINKARQPLFTVNLAHATATRNLTSSGCVMGGDSDFGYSCIDIRMDAVPQTNEALRNIKFRFLPGTDIDLLQTENLVGLNSATATQATLADGTVEVTVTFASGDFRPNDSLMLRLASVGSPSFCDGTCYLAVNDPLSVTFNFTSGFSSTGFYDNGQASSHNPGPLSFDDPNDPLLTEFLTWDPLLLANVNDPNGNRFIPFVDTFQIEVDVAEPTTLILLVSALVLLLASSRRQRSAGARA